LDITALDAFRAAIDALLQAWPHDAARLEQVTLHRADGGASSGSSNGMQIALAESESDANVAQQQLISVVLALLSNANNISNLASESCAVQLVDALMTLAQHCTLPYVSLLRAIVLRRC
jgi:hypothetical protein